MPTRPLRAQKKSTRDAKSVFPVRFESSREDRLTRHSSPARFSDSRVRMRLVLSASLSLRLDFFFLSPIEKLKARHDFPLSLFARSLRARPSSSRPRRSSRQERITAAQKRPILATFFLPSRKYTRTKTRQKCAEFVTPEYEEKGKTKKKRRRGKKLVQKRKENEATKKTKKRRPTKEINYQRGIKIFYMSKALVTAAVLPSASRVGSPRPAARRVVFAFFFTVIARRPPSFSRTHASSSSSSSLRRPQILFPTKVVERRRKDQTTKRKKIKSSSLSPKKGGPSCPFFVAWTHIFFFTQKISRSLLFFFSANTLNVLKNPKQKIQKET